MSVMRLLAACFALAVFGVAVVGAEVFFFEAEEYDEEKSNPAFNEQGLNAAWDIKQEDKDAFNKQYMMSRGANRDVVEAAAGLVYIVPSVKQPNGWALWVRCIMPTTGSDSFFYQISQDSGKNWNPPTAAHGGAQWEEWQWHRWNLGTLKKGEDNALRIGERENNAKLDVICLRNDGKIPTDEEYEQYLKDEPKRRFAVDARGKLAGTWGRVKSDVRLDY